jgi:Lrp/AsnC family leucine-responsive transcriptional regulator
MKETTSIDSYSAKILSSLQDDGRLTVQEIGDRIGLSSTPTWKRIKELERQGVIQRYAAILNRSKIGLGNCVLAEINLSRHIKNVVNDFEKAIQECPAIIECYSVTGQADYLIKVVTPDVASYDAFLYAVVFKLPGVSSIRSSIVLREVKSAAQLPLDHL